MCEVVGVCEVARVYGACVVLEFVRGVCDMCGVVWSVCVVCGGVC